MVRGGDTTAGEEFAAAAAVVVVVIVVVGAGVVVAGVCNGCSSCTDVVLRSGEGPGVVIEASGGLLFLLFTSFLTLDGEPAS